MQTISFQEIPNEYKELKDQITNSLMKKIYAQFTFFYFPCFLFHLDDNNKVLINDFLINFLRNHNLIIYQYSKCKSSSNDTVSDYIITVEGKCVIIKKANVAFMNDIFAKISSTIINAKSSFLEELIRNFCKIFQKERNKNNSFITLTLHSILGYLIGRFFYPSHFFKDPSFFKFDPNNNYIGDDIRLKLAEALKTYKNEETKKIINEINEKIVTEEDEYQNTKIYEFTKEDFITLKEIGKANSSNSFFYLVIHRESLFLFVIKILANYTNIKHESYFCENFTHPCITHFYGYMRKNGEINGLVYEFMSNGTLNDYIINNDVNEIYLQLTLVRIFQGIKFLHSHSLIHRDLKPQNILLDHDYLPYISDLETVRELTKDNTDLTTDFSSPIYGSPEQYMGECSLISFSSDIYSFGAIVYFVFEKKNMFEKNQSIISFLQKEDIPTLENASNNFQYIYKSCVKYNPKERLTIKQIEEIFMKEINSFDYLEKYSCQMSTHELTQYFTEIILFLANNKRILFKYLKFINNFHKMYSLRNDMNNSIFYYYLGKIFYNGICFDPDYSKSKYYFELSAKENNCKAILMLGDLYRKGRGVEEDYVKAKEYYELASKSNNSKAFLKIGDLYFDGEGVEQDYLKAKDYYELSSQINNSKSLLKIGDLYFDGKGVEKDYLKAKEYYELSAKFNNSDALFKLGNMLVKGLVMDNKMYNPMEYYELSAKLNNPQALVVLGSYLLNVLPDDLNYKKGKKYLELAAQQDYPQSFLSLGVMYETGKGVKQDCFKAKEYYETAVKHNCSDALTSLGLLYIRGEGINIDIQKAKYYLELAIKHNDPIAAYFLGGIYSNELQTYIFFFFMFWILYNFEYEF